LSQTGQRIAALYDEWFLPHVGRLPVVCVRFRSIAAFQMQLAERLDRRPVDS
jgi:hypothetical protein